MGQAEIADRARPAGGSAISWGVCEVPGWGLQLPPERVLSEMAELGLKATELGPQGWLPLDGAAVRAELDRYGLRARRRVRAGRRARADAASRACRAAPPSSSPPRAPTSSSPRSCRTTSGRAPVPLDDDGWRRVGTQLRELADLVGRAKG